jgi:hypothetical protein
MKKAIWLPSPLLQRLARQVSVGKSLEM